MGRGNNLGCYIRALVRSKASWARTLQFEFLKRRRNIVVHMLLVLFVHTAPIVLWSLLLSRPQFFTITFLDPSSDEVLLLFHTLLFMIVS